jgi:acetate kinase
MKIFILNQGSSTLKCYLYDFSSLPSQKIDPIWEAHVDHKDAQYTVTIKSHDRKTLLPDHSMKTIMASLVEGKTAVLSSLSDIDLIGHRIVHGGKKYKKSVLIDADVKKNIHLLGNLAPLHNEASLKHIETLESLLPKTPQIAVFDTAFHSTLSPAASTYPGPYSWIEEGIIRYGFHGISFQYCTRRVQDFFHTLPSRLLICHLGSGASLCAIKDGKSIDTTMGFTPLEGLMMDTRSGTIDPGILLYLIQKKHKSVEELSKELYERSGLLGLSELSSDMRTILASSDPKAKLALEVYLHRLLACIGSMIVSLQGLDTLVFTAGIGENAPSIRAHIANSLSFLGVKLDEEKNLKITPEDRDLSASSSKIKTLLIHTQEAFEIARECWLLSNS